MLGAPHLSSKNRDPAQGHPDQCWGISPPPQHTWIRKYILSRRRREFTNNSFAVQTIPYLLYCSSEDELSIFLMVLPVLYNSDTCTDDIQDIKSYNVKKRLNSMHTFNADNGDRSLFKVRLWTWKLMQISTTFISQRCRTLHKHGDTQEGYTVNDKCSFKKQKRYISMSQISQYSWGNNQRMFA